jgi:PadR family transcriptional regulator PadR
MQRKMRLTYPTALALAAISEGYRYGFDIMDVTGLPDGTVYPILRRLESRGQLVGRWEEEEEAFREGRPARRYYELTEQGESALSEALDRYPRLRSLIGGAKEGAPA